VTATPPSESDRSERSTHDASPEVRLNRLLGGSPRPTIAAAESCSGGEVAHRITAIAGSSVYFLGSIVSYSNGSKVGLLGVSPEIIETRGAVSEECARAMAEGARRAFGADVAVSTTGIAGPGGATARKPVGLVYTALADANGVTCREHHFSGDRKAVVDAAAEAALRLLIEHVTASLAASSSKGASIA
jgi:PncC family amidohydrolase